MKTTSTPKRQKHDELDFAGVDAPWMKQGQFGCLPTKKPCRECPLRKEAAPGYLGGYTAEQYIEILHSDADIACHLSPGFPHVLETQRSCTGVAGYRANVEKLPRGPHAAEAVRTVGKDATFFESPKQFLEHHKPMSDRYALMRKKRGL